MVAQGIHSNAVENQRAVRIHNFVCRDFISSLQSPGFSERSSFSRRVKSHGHGTGESFYLAPLLRVFHCFGFFFSVAVSIHVQSKEGAESRVEMASTF